MSDGARAERTVTLGRWWGGLVVLHGRPMAKLVRLAQSFEADVSIGFDEDRWAPADSYIQLMKVGAKGAHLGRPGVGKHVLVRAKGPDAEEAADAVADLLDSGRHPPLR